MWSVLAALPVGVPVDIGGPDARRAARRELARAPYQEHQPGPLQRLTAWIFERVMELLERVGGGNATYGFLGLLVLLVVVVLAIVAVRLKLGPFAGPKARDEALFAGRERTAAEHRRSAEAAAAAGDYAEAIRERLRAVIREFEQRGLLDSRPGRTADEAAAEAGTALPDCATDLRESARIFDDVWYGGRTATAEMYGRLRAVDEAVQAARPVPVGGTQ